MTEILTIIIIGQIFLILICYGLIFYQNLWIYYSENPEKHKYFPLLNPFSISTYSLMISSMFTLKWNENEGEKKRLKKNVNKIRKLLITLIGIAIISGVTSILIYALIVDR